MRPLSKAGFFMYKQSMISRSVHETEKIARDFAAKVRPRLSPAARATIVALSGDLGSGKTTFTKAFAAALGIPAEEITSPTFVIMKSYDLDPRQRSNLSPDPRFDLEERTRIKKFIHIDAYRLEKAEDIERLGWKELISDPSNLILIEWPENIGPALPIYAQKISFKFMDENTREIDYK
jgi:tRNA threonylcarbamoyladenosine biosynthesis protein TsaE